MPFSEVSICNMALARLGQSIQFTEGDGTVASLDESEPNMAVAVAQCQLFYDFVRDAVGRDFGYGSTTKYDVLVLASDGDGEVWEDVWENAWTYPADCLFLRRFVWPSTGIWPDTATSWVNWPWITAATSWAIGTHDGDKVIFANGVDEDNPLVEYTMVQSEAASNDVDVGLAQAWRLAAELAVPLLGVDIGFKARNECERQYALAVDVARRSSANEQGVGEWWQGNWMASRNG